MDEATGCREKATTTKGNAGKDERKLKGKSAHDKKLNTGVSTANSNAGTVGCKKYS